MQIYSKLLENNIMFLSFDLLITIQMCFWIVLTKLLGTLSSKVNFAEVW